MLTEAQREEIRARVLGYRKYNMDIYWQRGLKRRIRKALMSTLARTTLELREIDARWAFYHEVAEARRIAYFKLGRRREA